MTLLHNYPDDAFNDSTNEQLATHCPDCQTYFRVTQSELKALDGKVRCGLCATTFNALDNVLPIHQVNELLNEGSQQVAEPKSPIPKPSSENGVVDKRNTNKSKSQVPVNSVNTDWKLINEFLDKHELNENTQVFASDGSGQHPVLNNTTELSDVKVYANTAQVSGVSAVTDWALVNELLNDPAPSSEEDVLAEVELFLHTDTESTYDTEAIKIPETDWDHVSELLNESNAYADDTEKPKPEKEQVFISKEKSTFSIASFSWAIFMIAIGVALSYGYIERENLSKNKQLQPWFEALCDVVNCQASPLQPSSKVYLSHQNIRAHPSLINALLVETKLVNQTPEPQALPDIKVVLYDSSGNVVQTHTFSYREYLDRKSIVSHLIPNSQITISLDLANIDSTIVGYDIDV